jgi:hypothetical protein
MAMTNISLNNGGLGQGTASFGAASLGTQQNLTGLDALRAQPTFTFAGANELSRSPEYPGGDDKDILNPWGLPEFQNPYTSNTRQSLIPRDVPIPPYAADTDGDGIEDEIVVTGAPQIYRDRADEFASNKVMEDKLFYGALFGIAGLEARLASLLTSNNRYIQGAAAGAIGIPLSDIGGAFADRIENNLYNIYYNAYIQNALENGLPPHPEDKNPFPDFPLDSDDSDPLFPD